MTAYSWLALPIGYLLGSIPSAYLIGLLFGKVDMREAGDGRISAAAVYRKLGVIPFLLVVVIDVSKGALAVIIAYLMTGTPILFFNTYVDMPLIILLAGLLAVMGHLWSIFLKFRGGLGATVIYGVLAGLIIAQVLIAMIIGLVFFLITRKSGFGTAIIIILTSIVLLVQHQPLILVFYPFILILLMLIKRIQIRKLKRSVA
jgi:glycerol-3-phosphate acyltransferase PlsY